MEAPVCLVENRPDGLRVSPEALQLLSEIRKPVVVVSIIGLYRTGKSYLMNRLAGKTSGFSLGSTVQAKTKGIWMWCVPYPEQPHQTLVLLDTEGLGDTQKDSSQNDSWIFALAVLLSSTLVYNSMGIIDQTALDKLHFVTELSKRIKANTSSTCEDASEFVRFFPTFVWTLRDFTVQLEWDGQPITEDQYLEHALELKKDNTKENEILNLPHKCIRLFFPKRKCFIFECPTKRKNLPHLEQMEDSELEPEFVEPANSFCRYVFQTSEKKTLPGGHVVTGDFLAKLIKTYVDTICRGEVPCLENAVVALAKIENRAALQEAVGRYAELMDQDLQIPTENLQELLDVHKKCEEQALQMFMARAFKDDKHQFQVELMKTVESKKEEYCSKNELKSSEICSALLNSLSENLEKNINDGSYSRAGGHQEFLNDLQKVEEQFLETPKKGIMAGKFLRKFLQGKEVIGKTILKSDISIQKKEKEIEDEKMKAKAKEQEQEAQEQEMEMLKEKLEAQKQSHEMNLQKLKEKMVEERNQRKAENDKMIEQKLKEQQAFLKEGFEQEANQLKKEIKQLKKENEAMEEPSWISSALETLGNALADAMPIIWDKVLDAFPELIKYFESELIFLFQKVLGSASTS
ncbi:guanylate-binding protein 1 [Protobothrops mucrosquamatus]|uniref:guanylate-binding protein 1 n=1 Tax=Protobothrops mucrosquamatus TaxID=103944 RepID=UPI000775D110|nr:guanylate-binding protein 1 [Protobothrops mucrosquamatus]